MIERGFRILGWSCVLLGACVPFAIIGSHHRGRAVPWWEPLVLMAFGLVALLVPADVLVTHGRGPRTVLMAQLRGVLMLGLGSALIWWAWMLAVRRHRERRGAREDRGLREERESAS